MPVAGHPGGQGSDGSTHAPAPFDDTVFWIDPRDLQLLFAVIRHGDVRDEARSQTGVVSRSRSDRAVRRRAVVFRWLPKVQARRRRRGAVATVAMHLGSGKDYKLGWFNIELSGARSPTRCSTSRNLSRGRRDGQRFAGQIELDEASVSTLYANNVLEHVPDLTRLMTNRLLLMRGRQLHIEVPYERASTAWQDPTHVRALKGTRGSTTPSGSGIWAGSSTASSWSSSTYLDLKLQPCTQEAGGLHARGAREGRDHRARAQHSPARCNPASVGCPMIWTTRTSPPQCRPLRVTGNAAMRHLLNWWGGNEPR